MVFLVVLLLKCPPRQRNKDLHKIVPIVESSEEELVIDVECPELSLHNVVLDNEGYSKDRIDSNEYEAQPVSGSGKDDVKKKKMIKSEQESSPVSTLS